MARTGVVEDPGNAPGLGVHRVKEVATVDAEIVEAMGIETEQIVQRHTLRPGTPLAESDALATLAEKTLLRDPGVLSVGRRTGRAERDEHVLGVETSELEVRLKHDDPRTKEELFADVRERLRIVPGAQFEIGQPISHRIEHMISGQRSMLSIKVFGEDLRQAR